ncbi:MAG: type II toxin-antitoxin system RelE/ParE family toxin [Patescibacteria group bacterium]
MADLNNWQFEITETGKTDLERLDDVTRQRVLEKLEWFTENFQNITPLPLGGSWRGFFKLRVGDWRVVYKVDHDAHQVTVHVVDNRDGVYKRKRQ